VGQTRPLHYTTPQTSNPSPPSTEYYSLIEIRDTFTQLEVRQVELEQQVITLQSAQTQTTVQHNNTLLTRAGGGERHICTLDCGETTSTGERAGEEQSTRGEDQTAGGEGEGEGV
jgi:hypothetical protein